MDVYAVFMEGELVGLFSSEEQAILYAERLKKASDDYSIYINTVEVDEISPQDIEAPIAFFFSHTIRHGIAQVDVYGNGREYGALEYEDVRRAGIWNGEQYTTWLHADSREDAIRIGKERLKKYYPDLDLEEKGVPNEPLIAERVDTPFIRALERLGRAEELLIDEVANHQDVVALWGIAHGQAADE